MIPVEQSKFAENTFVAKENRQVFRVEAANKKSPFKYICS